MHSFKDPRDRLIVALDTPEGAPNAVAGGEMSAQIGDAAGWRKIGLGMLATGGMALALALLEQGIKVFLDLKLYDIGQTIENATRGVCRWGPHYLTVHGDPPVVRAACEGRGDTQTKILAVSFLTSLERADLDSMLITQGDMHGLQRSRCLYAHRGLGRARNTISRCMPTPAQTVDPLAAQALGHQAWHQLCK
jgi:orotidine-5'-phosphate decarboxylase